MLLLKLLTLCSLLYAVQCTPKDERIYLKSFYDSLKGTEWTTDWELTDEDSDVELEKKLLGQEALTWEDTDGYGFGLVTLNLTNSNLEGVIPDGIDALETLRHLILPSNSITSLPDLSSMTTLEYLDVSHNLLKGYDRTFHSSLTKIRLNNNTINLDIVSFLAKFGSRESITLLDLSGNDISGSLKDSTILSEPELTYLDLSYNSISGDLNADSIKTDGWLGLNISYNALSGTYPPNLKGVVNKVLRCNMFDCTSLTNDTAWNVTECFCPLRGYEVELNSDSEEFECVVCENGTMANKWVRFGYLSEDHEDPVEVYYCDTPSVGCIQCMFPRNCVQGGCVEGSTGPTCELCEDGWRMVGGGCKECLESKVPIAALVMVIFVAIIIGYGIFLTGLNVLASTMIKQLMTYLQIYYLTLDMKVPWPRYLSELADVFKLSMLNTQAFDLECLASDLSTKHLFYIHWSTAVLWPLLITVVTVLLDKKWSRQIHEKEHADGAQAQTIETLHLRSKQNGVRRIYIMFMIIAFVPVTCLSVRMYACDYWSPQVVTVKYNDGAAVVKNQWFYDNSVSCYDYTFQGVNFLATMFCVVEFGIIVFLFLILFRLWRFDLKDKHNEIFGALYESFTQRGLFCEPFLLLRKFILILCTQVTYMDPLYSGGANFILSFGWLSMILIVQPYIKITETGGMAAFLNNWCNLFEIAATLLITITQFCVFLYGFQLWDDVGDKLTPTTLNVLDYIMTTMHVLLVIVWVIGFILVLVKWTKTGIRDRRDRRSSKKSLRRAAGIVMNPLLHAGRVGRVTPVDDTTDVIPESDGEEPGVEEARDM